MYVFRFQDISKGIHMGISFYKLKNLVQMWGLAKSFRNEYYVEMCILLLKWPLQTTRFQQ